MSQETEPKLNDLFKSKMLQNLGGGHDVGVFGVHVDQAGGMAGLQAVEAGIVRHGNAVVGAEPVYHCCTHATRSAASGYDQRVHAEQGKVGLQGRSEKSGRFLLADDQIVGLGFDGIYDLIWMKRGFRPGLGAWP